MRKLRHEGHRGADKNLDDAVDISKPLKKGTTRVENKEFETGTYTGDWMDGAPNGKGKHTFSDGDVYKGDWVEGKEHGKGKYKWSDGRVYEGDHLEDMAHGKGTVSYTHLTLPTKA